MTDIQTLIQSELGYRYEDGGLLSIAKQVSSMILPYTRGYCNPPLMVDYPLDELVLSMEKGHSVVIMDGNNVAGHVRVKEHQGLTQSGKQLLELGSLIVSEKCKGQNLSQLLITQMLEKLKLAGYSPNTCQLISVVGNVNGASVNAFNKVTGVKILGESDWPQNLLFAIPETEKIIFDLTDTLTNNY